MIPSSVAVVYIARRTEGAVEALTAFLNSLAENPPGCEHRLVVIAKGWAGDKSGFQEIRELVDSGEGEVICLPDDGYDWGAYMRVALKLSEEWLCFLNSHSRVAGANWLAHLLSAAGKPGIGMAGATGSYGTWAFVLPYWSSDLSSVVLYPLRVAKAAIGSLQHYRDSTPFPSFHLRSNAFAIRREVFLSFCRVREMPSSKREAHSLESGTHSLTTFLRQHELLVVVVGRDGKSYLPDQWPDSQTFRVPGQRNLLVHDNQTDRYENADSRLKRSLEWGAWRRTFNH